MRRSEQNPSVSYRYKYVVAVTDDQQAQQSMSGIFANAQNILITGGTIVSLDCKVGLMHDSTTSRVKFSLKKINGVRN